MVHKLVKYIQNFQRESLFNTYFYGLRGRQTQGPPRAAHTLARQLESSPIGLQQVRWEHVKSGQKTDWMGWLCSTYAKVSQYVQKK